MARKAVDKSSNISFEEAMGKLEIIVKQLEKGELPLEESLNRYAEGVNLSKLCLIKLNDAEKKINEILHEENGKIVARPLKLEEED